MGKYNTRIDNCNIKKVCESRIKFPAHFVTVDEFFSTNDTLIFYTQYIGDSNISTRLEFSQQLAPAYTAYFTSSLCHTPPHYCSCIKLGVQSSNPVSYFVPEANRAEHFFIPDKGGHEFDIHFASSLYINMSACEERNYKIWWMLKFSKLVFIDGFKIKTTNTSIPLMINEPNLWHILQLDALLTHPFVCRFLLHIIENAPSSGHPTDIASKVCIHCLLCHNIRLSVEVLQQGKGESIVYNITNYTLIKGANYTHTPFEPECITGITCTLCNIILTYRGSLPQSQTKRCGCEYLELGVFVKTLTREKKSTSETSVKRNPISKISTR